MTTTESGPLGALRALADKWRACAIALTPQVIVSMAAVTRAEQYRSCADQLEAAIEALATPGAGGDACPKVSIELPDGDDRAVKVWFTEWVSGGAELRVSIQVLDALAATPGAGPVDACEVCGKPQAVAGVAGLPANHCCCARLVMPTPAPVAVESEPDGYTSFGEFRWLCDCDERMRREWTPLWTTPRPAAQVTDAPLTENLRFAGQRLSCIAFNLAQEGRLSQADRSTLAEAYKRWDAALADTPAPVAVESDWVLVPRVATITMLVAMSKALGMQPLGDGTDGDYPITGQQSTIRQCFAAMLAAAPAPQVTDAREAFIAHYQYLDLSESSDAWGRPMFARPHVQALFAGWEARAALRPNANPEGAIQSCTCYDDTARRLCRRKGACLVATAQGEGDGHGHG